jgi:hypothetical protein
MAIASEIKLETENNIQINTNKRAYSSLSKVNPINPLYVNRIDAKVDESNPNNVMPLASSRLSDRRNLSTGRTFITKIAESRDSSNPRPKKRKTSP